MRNFLVDQKFYFDYIYKQINITTVRGPLQLFKNVLSQIF